MSVALNRILDGSGGGYKGLRAAASVHAATAGGVTRYRLEYGGMWEEEYWVEDSTLKRALNGGTEERMVRATALTIQKTPSDSDPESMYEVTLEALGTGGEPLSLTAQVRLRNYVAP
jgi:hypothetical protein